MTARNEGGQIAVFARQAHPNVACQVRVDLQAEFLPDHLEIVKHFRFGCGIPLSGYTQTIGAHFANRIKNRAAEFHAVSLQIPSHNATSFFCQYHVFAPLTGDKTPRAPEGTSRHDYLFIIIRKTPRQLKRSPEFLT